MGNDVVILMLTNQDERFYPLLGPFLSRREIVAELGFPVYDDPGKLWFVALDGGNLAGFGGVRIEHDRTTFCSDYVLPAHRGHRVHDRLMRERLRHVIGRAKVAQAVVTNAARCAYERHGFAPTRQMRRYTKMERSLM